MKPFEKWKTEEVELNFGISQADNSIEMTTWLAYQTTFATKITDKAEELRIRHKNMADFWGEEDIKVFFVVPIIDLVEFYERNKYRTFMDCMLQADLKDINQKIQTVRGKVELLVAKGKQDPQIPMFFLNEYKPQIKAQADPKGQLLIAMLAAQAKNNGLNLPIYGLYTIGQNWYFVLLKDSQYTLSKQFDASDADDLTQILNMLQFVKEHIERNL